MIICAGPAEILLLVRRFPISGRRVVEVSCEVGAAVGVVLVDTVCLPV